MALLSKTTIYIESNEVPTFKHLFLNQQIDAHHTLEVVFRMDTFESDSSELGEKSKEFLGKKIAVQIGSISNQSDLGALEFQGIITEIKITKGNNTGAGDEIIVLAKSPTIFADNGAHYDSFNEEDLSFVVDKILQPYELDYEISPRYKGKIDYCVQQNESGFSFISRLAAQYGEWYYYNGKRLIFGKPESEETELRYAIDLNSYDINLTPLPQNHNYYTNDYLTDKIEKNQEYSKPVEVSAVDGFLFDKSETIFKRQTILWNNNNNNTNREDDKSPSAKDKLNIKVKSQQEGHVIQQLNLRGSSSNPGVKLGNIVKIEDEKYRVIEISHSTDRSGHYQNNFKAISGSFDAYPRTNINAFPKSRCQVAIVKENHDPKNMGRIKVQFPWQKEAKNTPWIRLASLHAGGGKGFYFLPEIGEEVIVDFEGGNAETPIVTGCLYHSGGKPPEAGSNPNNDIKILQTKSGCSLTFNDEDGSITLMDKGGSSIVLDGSGSISISAKSEVSISGKKEVSLQSDDEVSLNGAKEVSIISKGEKGEISLNAAKEVSINSDDEVFIKGTKEVGINSDIEVKMTGLAKATVSSSGTTSIEGTIIKLN